MGAVIFVLYGLAVTSVQAATTFKGQIYRRQGVYFVIREYGAILPAYRLEFDPRVDTRRLCLANLNKDCPDYDITIGSVHDFGESTVFRGVRVAGFGPTKLPR